MRRFSALRLATILVGILALTGCPSSKATVSGTVTYKGKPLPSGKVILFGAGNIVVSGDIQPDGSYTVAQVPLGSTKVAVQSGAVGGGAHGMGPGGPGGAGAETKMMAGPKGSEEHSPPPKEGAAGPAVNLPSQYANEETSGLTCTVQRGKNTFNIDLK